MPSKASGRRRGIGPAYAGIQVPNDGRFQGATPPAGAPVSELQRNRPTSAACVAGFHIAIALRGPAAYECMPIGKAADAVDRFIKYMWRGH